MELKRLLNKSEETTIELLKQVCDEWDAHVFIKVRLADVFPIEASGISSEDYRFALQSHFDFIATNDDLIPLFAVEFDGEYHQSNIQRQRDTRKNSLCMRFDFPLLRINARYLRKDYRNMDLLSWFVNMWFAFEMLTTLQAEGSIPWDEPLHPQSLMTLPGSSETFPLMLSWNISAKFLFLKESGRCWDAQSSDLVGKDESDNYHAIGWLRVTPSTVVLAKTAMRSQLFPVPISDVLEDIIDFELYQQLMKVFEGIVHPITETELETEIKKFERSYKIVRMSMFSKTA